MNLLCQYCVKQYTNSHQSRYYKGICFLYSKLYKFLYFTGKIALKIKNGPNGLH